MAVGEVLALEGIATSVKKRQQVSRGMLVVAPLKPAYQVWPQEIDKWTDFEDITYAVVHGKHWRYQLELDVDVHITTPETLEKVFSVARRWDILCIDESSDFKNSQSKRFKLLRSVLDRFDRRWILTGSLSPNGLMDIFSQIYILDTGRALGRYITHYRNKFFHTLPYSEYDYIPNPGAFEEITDRIDPLLMRLRAIDHLVMPELPYVEPTYIDLPPEARKIYTELEDEFITETDAGTIIAANSAVAGGKLRQICNGALYTDASKGEYLEIHEEKIEALAELINSLVGSPALVMYEFNHDRERLRKRFGETSTFIDSSTSVIQTNRILTDFNSGRIPVLFGHPQTMARGLNLQEACHSIIWFSLTWNLLFYEQAIARIWRQGQKSPFVMNYRIIARGTKEDDVVKALAQKDVDQNKIYAALRYNIPSK